MCSEFSALICSLPRRDTGARRHPCQCRKREAACLSPARQAFSAMLHLQFVLRYPRDHPSCHCPEDSTGAVLTPQLGNVVAALALVLAAGRNDRRIRAVGRPAGAESLFLSSVQAAGHVPCPASPPSVPAAAVRHLDLPYCLRLFNLANCRDLRALFAWRVFLSPSPCTPAGKRANAGQCGAR